ncbi:MAG: SRPBCC family protein [Acidimicrobiia bacterium]|nr:MAG: SRPBCC family protein [Acidimicrobiia bacterium]
MEGTVQSIEVSADPQRIYEIAIDLEAYPDWAKGVRSAQVTEVDDQGRPIVADFTVDGMIKEIAYTLEYDFDQDNGFAWSARPNTDITVLEGSYQFNALDNGAGTEVVYALRVEPTFKVPGFLRRQAEKQIVGTALRGLKNQAEADA